MVKGVVDLVAFANAMVHSLVQCAKILNVLGIINWLERYA